MSSTAKVIFVGVMSSTAFTGLMSMVKESLTVRPPALPTLIVTRGGKSSLLKVGFDGMLV